MEKCVLVHVARVMSVVARNDPVNVIDAIHPLDGGQDGLEVRGVPQLELEAHTADAVGSGLAAARKNADVEIDQYAGDVEKKARTVDRANLD